VAGPRVIFNVFPSPLEISSPSLYHMVEYEEQSSASVLTMSSLISIDVLLFFSKDTLKQGILLFCPICHFLHPGHLFTACCMHVDNIHLKSYEKLFEHLSYPPYIWVRLRTFITHHISCIPRRISYSINTAVCYICSSVLLLNYFYHHVIVIWPLSHDYLKKGWKMTASHTFICCV
jgi:hypothetical protein